MRGVPWSKKDIARAARFLQQTGGNLTQAAKLFGTSQQNFSRCVAHHNIPRPAYAAPGDLSAAKERAQRSFEQTHRRVLEKKLLEAEKASNFYTAIRPVTIVSSRGAPKTGKREGTPFTVASDWHFGEVVTREETQGRNEYHIAEAHRRAKKFWDNVLWLRQDIQRSVTARDHILNLNGDMISGSIHDELSQTNEVALPDQVGEVAAALESGIRALAPTCRKLIIVCTHGNHGRWTQGKSMIKIGWAVSLETMLYRYLIARLRDVENIEWHVPKAESLSINVYDWRVSCQHGTHIRSQGGIGGILVPLTRWATRRGIADYYVFGHFHQACAFESVIVNGALIGTSSYSEELGLSYREAEQVNFVLDERRGLRRFDRVSVT